MGLKLYSKKHRRYVERQIHFGVGNGAKTACGLNLFSRYVMVSVFSAIDGSLITDDMSRVTCRRCLATSEMRLRNLVAIEQAVPGIFDRETLCGEKWLLDHALDIKGKQIDAQSLEVSDGNRTITLFNTIKKKDRKYLLSTFK